MTRESSVRTWQPDGPLRVSSTLVTHRRGACDPTYVQVGGGVVRGLLTPDGPVTLQVRDSVTGGPVEASAWGPGADWTLDRVPRMLGADDDASGFRPEHPVLAQAIRRRGVVPLGATGLVLDALVPAVIEQKVTGQEAYAGYRRLVRRFGRPAPGPWSARGLYVPPDPPTLARIASWEWLSLPISPDRSRTLVTVARRADALERLGLQGADALDRGLRSLPGVGRWTSAEVRARALGDPDAVSVGDYHVAADIGWALTGRVTGDAEMLRLLEPYRGHRLRVQRIVETCGLGRPRRGPRMAPRTHLPGRVG